MRIRSRGACWGGHHSAVVLVRAKQKSCWCAKK
jgi:hypothetical protein